MTEQEQAEKDQAFDEAITMPNPQPGESGSLVETTALATVESNPARLLELAVQKDLDIDKLERLMAMKERWDAQQAKEAFYGALSQFQKIVPVLEKSGKVAFGTTKYSFAPLPDIKAGIQDSLSECDLSYRWEFADNAGLIDVTCIITHKSGHSEKTTMTAPADSSGSKNPVQERASTITYLQRYTLIGALGLTTANMDDDGRKGQVDGPTPEEAAANLPEVPEGTETKAPKPEKPGKTDFEKRQQLLGYLKEICRIPLDKKILSDDEKKKLSDELEKLSAFDVVNTDGTMKTRKEDSLRNLSGDWLNTTIGKAKAKLGYFESKDTFLDLLNHPALSQEYADEFRKEAADKRHKEQWFKDQIEIVKGLIADKERDDDKQGTLL